MTISPNFYFLRLRNSSLWEIFWRFYQSLTRPYIFFFQTIGKEVPTVPKLGSDAIINLITPRYFSTEESTYSIDEETVRGVLSKSNNLICKENDQIQIAGSVSPIEDIRLTWEPARLQQALWLLINAHQHSDLSVWNKAKQASKSLILRWLNANPFARGVHYNSVMECALRIPVFVLALKHIDSFRSADYDLILKTIFRHAWLISKRMSLYSSLGNHTITEAVGLLFAGAVFRSTREGLKWIDTGLNLLSKELSHQIYKDGGPAEQSLNYHRFVLDLYWLALDFVKKNNFGDVLHWESRLSTAESFLGAFQDSQGCFPAIGDSDDGFAIAPGISPARNTGGESNQPHMTFPESGYSVIRNDQLVFTLDHGPLGLAPFYNHGHADALAITLSKKGRPILVDPGTYRYNGAQQWRRYFKGTQAHNTVTIDDQDQAIQETAFIWSKPYNAGLTGYKEENGDLLYIATHDGYTRLKSPVKHQRSVFFYDQESFVIKDRFFGAGIHCFQLNFHLHPMAKVTIDGKWWIIDHMGEQIFLRLCKGDFQAVRGQKNPLMGWYSSRYGQKEPTCTLTCTRTGNADRVVFTTLICTQKPFGGDCIDIKAGEIEGKIKNS